MQKKGTFMMRTLFFLSLVVITGTMTGCFQAHSDDALRTIPATNNPHIIQDSNKTANVSGIGY